MAATPTNQLTPNACYGVDTGTDSEESIASLEASIEELRNHFHSLAESLVQVVKDIEKLETRVCTEKPIVGDVRRLCNEILVEAGADGLGGCDLCRG